MNSLPRMTKQVSGMLSLTCRIFKNFSILSFTLVILRCGGIRRLSNTRLVTWNSVHLNKLQYKLYIYTRTHNLSLSLSLSHTHTHTHNTNAHIYTHTHTRKVKKTALNEPEGKNKSIGTDRKRYEQLVDWLLFMVYQSLWSI